MAISILYSYTPCPWLGSILEAILHKISFIYRLIIHAFTYYEICSMPIAISILHGHSHNLFPWPYLILEAILYSYKYTLHSKL